MPSRIGTTRQSRIRLIDSSLYRGMVSRAYCAVTLRGRSGEQNGEAETIVKPISLLVALGLLIARPASSYALEPFVTGTESDEELTRPAEDRDWEVGNIAVTATLHAEKGWTYFNKKQDVQSALNHFETAIKMWPNTVQAILGKAYCLDSLGRKQEALRVLSRCQCRNQISPDVISLTEIELLTELKHYHQALRVCDRIATERPGGAPFGYWLPTFADLIPRGNVLLAKGDTSGAIRVANKMYLFGIGNPYAKRKALELFERCGASPPTGPPNTSSAKAKVLSTIRTLISDFSWTDQKALEKVLHRKLIFHSANGNEFYSFHDQSDCLIASASLFTKGQARATPSLSIVLDYPMSLLTYDELKKSFPRLQFHPATKSGCIYTPAYSDFSEGGNQITFDGGNSDPPDIVTGFTITRLPKSVE